jgi:hypothetical protein
MSAITKMQIRAKTVQLVIAMSCAVPAQAVLAGDGTIYPGRMCTANRAAHTVDMFSSVSNPSPTARLTVDCPIVRQQTERPIDAGSWVRLVDQHTTQNIECEMVSAALVSLGTGGVWYSGRVRTVGWGDHVQQFSFGGFGANNISSSSMWCSLPPTQDGRPSYVLSYKIVENN